MMIKNITSLLIALLVPVSMTLHAQRHEWCSFKINGIERTCLMYLPTGMKANAPLVFVLHGYGGTVKENDYDFDKTAEKHGFALCFPQGVKDSTGHKCWNVGYPFQADMKVNDVDMLCKMAKLVQKKYKLSVQNTFCCGMSNGGEMCYLLAYSKQNTFAALAPIAGLTLVWMYQQLEGPKPIPLFEIHGTKDHTSEWTGDLTNKGGWGAYMPVPIAVNYWVAKNRCLEEKTDTLAVKNKDNGHYVITHKFINGIGGNEVWLYEVVNGPHSWGATDLDTCEEIWKFFSKYIK
jgi:polyhydroxybutyrate depolymerase